MIKIAVYSLKGGVGKTITAANLGQLYATHRTKRLPGTKRGSLRRVLLVDRDPQGNLSQYFNRYSDGPLEDHPIGTDWAWLDILPGNLSLSAQEDAALDVDRYADKYDLCLIDCPPALGKLTAAAIRCADYLFIPIRLDAFSTNGLSNLMQQLANLQEAAIDARVLGVLVTHDEKTPYSDAIKGLLREQLPLFDTTISRSKWVAESTIEHKPLAEIVGPDPKHPLRPMTTRPAWQYRKVFNEMADRLSKLDKGGKQ